MIQRAILPTPRQTAGVDHRTQSVAPCEPAHLACRRPIPIGTANAMLELAAASVLMPQ
jgi:hypothetical protein